MKRVLGFLMLLASGLLVLTMMAGLATQLDFRAMSGHQGNHGIEPVSFALGAIAALSITWIVQLPWGSVGESISAAARMGRRLVTLLVLAVGFAGVLLLY